MSQAFDSQPMLPSSPAEITPPPVVTSPFARLQSYLSQVRRRLLRREKLRLLLLWLQATGVCGAAVLLLAAQTGPHWAWLPICGVYALLALLALAVLQVRARSERTSDEAMARFVGARLPDLRSELLSTIELQKELTNGPERALVEELAQRTLAALGTVQPDSLVDRWPVWQAGLSALMLFGFGLFATLAGVLPLAKGLHTLGTVSPPEPVSIATEPLLGDIRLLLVYPKYTGLHQRTIPGSTGDILALPGTQVRIEAWALVPVERAQITVIADGQEIGVDLDADRAQYSVSSGGVVAVGKGITVGGTDG